jgi:hypothetical protein
MCKLFDDYMQEEAPGDSGKVGELLVSFLQCLLENKCISSSSQSTEKIICSSQNENTSSGTNNQSNSTIKLPSNETSRNIGQEAQFIFEILLLHNSHFQKHLVFNLYLFVNFLTNHRCFRYRIQ